MNDPRNGRYPTGTDYPEDFDVGFVAA